MPAWRSASELMLVSDPAWPGILREIGTAAVTVQVVSAAIADRARAIESLQVTARSALGALTSQCGAITCDHGWLRLLGAGAPGLPSVRDMTDLVLGLDPKLLIVAVDIVGGRFAINGGDLEVDAQIGEVCYWGPDTLDWMPLDLGHGAFNRGLGWRLDRAAGRRWSTSRRRRDEAGVVVVVKFEQDEPDDRVHVGGPRGAGGVLVGPPPDRRPVQIAAVQCVVVDQAERRVEVDPCRPAHGRGCRRRCGPRCTAAGAGRREGGDQE